MNRDSFTLAYHACQMSEADLIVAAILVFVYIPVVAYQLHENGDYVGHLLGALAVWAFGLGIVFVVAHFAIKYW